MGTPRGHGLSYKLLLPTYSPRRYTHTKFVSCHFMLSCYLSASTTYNFVPSHSALTQLLM